MITLIISGGQTGADQAGLRAAKAKRLATGGWAPRGFVTEVGPSPWLRTDYGLMEHETSADYAPRTLANVQMANATVIFGKRSRGSNLTERLCQQEKRNFCWIPYPSTVDRFSQAKFRLWISRVSPATLNVAGNRESVNPGIGAWVERFLLETL